MLFIAQRQTRTGETVFTLFSAPDRAAAEQLDWEGVIEIYTDIEPVLIWQYGGTAQLTVPD